MWKPHHSRNIFGSWECGAKHISKSKRNRDIVLGALSEVEMFNNCTPAWHEGHFKVKSGEKKLTVTENFWRLRRCRKSTRRCGAKNVSKSKVKHTTLVPLWAVQMSFFVAGCATTTTTSTATLYATLRTHLKRHYNDTTPHYNTPSPTPTPKQHHNNNSNNNNSNSNNSNNNNKKTIITHNTSNNTIQQQQRRHTTTTTTTTTTATTTTTTTAAAATTTTTQERYNYNTTELQLHHNYTTVQLRVDEQGGTRNRRSHLHQSLSHPLNPHQPANPHPP